MPRSATGPDEATGPPDFVGIGTQKAGTTWWFDAICAHPDVYSRADIHKERHFFGRYAVRPFGPAECTQYHDWFPRPPDSLTGEWTPDYIHCPWVPALLARAAPRTRLVLLTRSRGAIPLGTRSPPPRPRKPHGRDIPGCAHPRALSRCTASMGCVFPARADPRPAVRAMHGRSGRPARSNVPLPRAGTICPRRDRETSERHRAHPRLGRRRPTKACRIVRVRRARARPAIPGHRSASVAELRRHRYRMKIASGSDDPEYPHTTSHRRR